MSDPLTSLSRLLLLSATQRFRALRRLGLHLLSTGLRLRLAALLLAVFLSLGRWLLLGQAGELSGLLLVGLIWMIHRRALPTSEERLRIAAMILEFGLFLSLLSGGLALLLLAGGDRLGVGLLRDNLLGALQSIVFSYIILDLISPTPPPRRRRRVTQLVPARQPVAM